MDRFLSPKQVRAITSISERQQDRLVARGQFPKPIALYEGGRRKAFRESEIEGYMAARVAAARGAAAAPKAATDRSASNGHETERAGPKTRRGKNLADLLYPPNPRREGASSGRGPPRQAQPPPRRAQRRPVPKTPI
jgi:predicted DNA-binding transcriptional regulator AlpA